MEPGVQKEPAAVEIAPLSTKEASAPGAREPADSATKVRGPAEVWRVQVSDPPEMMEQGAEQLGVLPTSVPANTTSQEAGVAQDIGLPPLFLMETAMAMGGAPTDCPALTDAPTIEMLELAAALPTRL